MKINQNTLKDITYNLPIEKAHEIETLAEKVIQLDNQLMNKKDDDETLYNAICDAEAEIEEIVSAYGVPA